MIPLYFIGDDFEHLTWARAPFFSSVWQLARHGQEGLFLRPFASASIFLEFRLWHLWPAGYHITNLAIHLLSVAGLYWMCRALRLGKPVASLAALLFAVMPVEVEAVAWLGARFDLLSACLSIWSAFFYFKFRSGASRAAYGAALACFGCALLSKENAYLFPAALLAAEWLLLPVRRWKPLAGFLLLASALFSYRWLILGGVGGYKNAAGQPIALHAGFKLLQGLFVRDPALLLAGYNWVQPSLAATVALSALTFGTLLALTPACRPSRAAWKQFAFCLVWIAVPLLPAHPLLLIQPDLTNARILYFSAAGMALLLAFVLNSLHPIRLRSAGAALLTGLYSFGTLHNLGAWRFATLQEERLLADVQRLAPAPPAHTLFVFQDMPGTLRGVYLLQAGLPQAIRLRFGRADLDAVRARSGVELPPADAGRPLIRFQWTVSAGQAAVRAGY